MDIAASSLCSLSILEDFHRTSIEAGKAMNALVFHPDRLSGIEDYGHFRSIHFTQSAGDTAFIDTELGCFPTVKIKLISHFRCDFPKNP